MNVEIEPHIKLDEIPGKTWFVGDIHGRYDELMNALLEVGFDFANDRLIATGDLIDYGDRSEACLHLLTKPWFYSVVGRHEIMALKAINSQSLLGLVSEEQKDHMENGGEWLYEVDTLDSQENQQKLAELIISSMPISYEVSVCGSKIGVVHASIHDDWDGLEAARLQVKQSLIEQCTSDNFDRKAPMKVAGIDVVVMGESQSKEVVRKGNQLWIDTVEQTDQLTIVPAQYVLNNCARFIH